MKKCIISMLLILTTITASAQSLIRDGKVFTRNNQTWQRVKDSKPGTNFNVTMPAKLLRFETMKAGDAVTSMDIKTGVFYLVIARPQPISQQAFIEALQASIPPSFGQRNLTIIPSNHKNVAYIVQVEFVNHKKMGIGRYYLTRNNYVYTVSTSSHDLSVAEKFFNTIQF